MSDALVSTADLAAQRGAFDLVVLDASYHTPDAARDAAAEFVAGHLPGARFLDLAALRADDPRPMMLPAAAAFAARMQALGVGSASRVILYDDSPHHTAARAWWMLRGFGVRRVAILDGGLAKWRSEGRALERGTPSSAPGDFAATAYPVVRTLDEVRANIATAAEQLVDARPAPRFTGKEPDLRPGMPSGHIPGSLNLPQSRLFAADGTWLAGDALAAAFADAGVDLDRPVVTTCGSGITAAVLAFGLHLLGREAALYDGSWAEWGADPATPKATGAA